MPGSFQKLEWKGFFHVKVVGYFDDTLGGQIETLIMDFLQGSGKNWILDLTDCEVVNSPAVSSILELTLKTMDDFSGRVVVVGGNNLIKRVFRMAGIFPMAEEYPTLEAIP